MFKRMVVNMKLGTKLLAGIGLTLVAMVLITAMMVSASQLILLGSTVEQDIQASAVTVEGLLTQQAERAQAIAATAAVLPEIIEAGVRGEREEALSLMEPIYNEINQRYGVTVLHYMRQAPGDRLRAFARSHDPDNPGGREVTFGPILEAARSGEAIAGFRTTSYGLGMRGWVPVFADRRVTGVMEVNIPFTPELLSEIEQGLVDTTLAVFTPENNTFQLQSGRAPIQPTAALFDQAREGLSQVEREGDLAYALFPLTDYTGNVLAVIGVYRDVAAFTTMVGDHLFRLLAVIIVLGLAVLVVTLLVVRSITGPIGRTVQMIKEMGRGRLDSRLKMERGDEIGQMATAMDEFADTLQHQLVGSLQKLAQGDLTFEIKPYDDQDMIGNALLKTNRDLNRIVGEINAATEQIASNSSQVAGSSQSLSQGATESAASLEQITSSMTEMASQTKLNAENSTQANHLAGEARQVAESGNEQMEKMMEAMAEINQAGQNISKIIKVIDEIAFQTNLLALNAAVEAARAGRHGKGFAVVAEEVRNLAARSAKAAKETAELIEGSVAKTANGTEIAAQTAESLKEIVTAITKATDLVGEIAAASNEQAQGISQVNQGLSQIDQVTQTNTANAEEGAAAAEELSSQADHLRGLMATFTVKGGSQMTQSRRQKALPAAPAQHKSAHQEFKGWDQAEDTNGRKTQPSEVIALDDREFGRY
ncbi:methyl-accepting chemotaxis protein [Desulfurivibrio alkaliphilus]|uniref:Methyl-accepting chemotaxis sensory transducer n=1 Tax=Desulfurivibrio alkaliphilus (strain DSM 19089 / UNIQEM U267 / AHT2) TaxID=589865 RepID=D6Z1A6_DESAT|nr:methyl-accepting chemotaxis protein [Desulfurivibrio alkaliphilus]ADH85361.1 methyl-accepting chemotaxis sensory transducer [Desulfurivibrio alkaliphilus AHT 2]